MDGQARQVGRRFAIASFIKFRGVRVLSFTYQERSDRDGMGEASSAPHAESGHDASARQEALASPSSQSENMPSSGSSTLRNAANSGKREQSVPPPLRPTPATRVSNRSPRPLKVAMTAPPVTHGARASGKNAAAAAISDENRRSPRAITTMSSARRPPSRMGAARAGLAATTADRWRVRVEAPADRLAKEARASAARNPR